MPDPSAILQAIVAAALAAAAVVLLVAWPGRGAHPRRAVAASVLGVGVGFLIGDWQLGLWPRWPPPEDQGRFLFLLLPALVAVELFAAWLPGLPKLVWATRLALAAAVPPVLLHGTVYLTAEADAGGWSRAQTAIGLGTQAVALAGTWTALTRLSWRRPGRSLPLALAGTCAGAGATIALSGYATCGEVGLALAATLAGATLATLVLAPLPDLSGAVGMGVVGLVSLLIMGRFFGELSAVNGILLLIAPLLCWLPELLPRRGLALRLSGLCRLILAAAPVIVALVWAQQKFAADAVQTSPRSDEPSMQDYMDFGK